MAGVPVKFATVVGRDYVREELWIGGTRIRKFAGKCSRCGHAAHVTPCAHTIRAIEGWHCGCLIATDT